MQLGEAAIGFTMRNRRVQDALSRIITQAFELWKAYMPEQVFIGTTAEGGPEQFTRQDMNIEAKIEVVIDPMGGNRAMQMQRDMALMNMMLPILEKYYPVGVIPMAREMLALFGRTDRDQILPEETIQHFEQGQQAARQMQGKMMEMEAAVKDAEINERKSRAKGRDMDALLQMLRLQPQERQQAMKLVIELEKIISENERSDRQLEQQQYQLVGEQQREG